MFINSFNKQRGNFQWIPAFAGKTFNILIVSAVCEKKLKDHRLRRYRFGGSATAVPPLKFQQKMAYFKGKWHAAAARDAI